MSSNMTPFSVNLDPLLAPIAGDSPAGESVRYEGTYDKVQEARRADDPTLPQGEWKTALKVADWRLVANICQDALAHKSKDLQLAAWLLEAWVEQYGFRGLDVGFQLIGMLLERYWETAYPELDVDEPERRLAPFAWIDDKITIKLKKLPLTSPDNSDAPPYTFADWEMVLLQERSGDAKSRHANTSLQAKFLSGASMTSPAFYSALAKDLDSSLEGAFTIEQIIESHLPAESGALRRIRECIEQIQRLLETLHGTAMPMPLGSPMSRNASSDALVANESSNDAPRTRLIQSRADAYRLLVEASDFLLLTEPHSPTPYLVKRAISWGDMPLGKVLEEIVPSSDALEAIYALLGIRDESRSSDE